MPLGDDDEEWRPRAVRRAAQPAQGVAKAKPKKVRPALSKSAIAAKCKEAKHQMEQHGYTLIPTNLSAEAYVGLRQAISRNVRTAHPPPCVPELALCEKRT